MQSKQKTFSIENFGSGSDKKKEIVNLIIKSDVQGSSEAISSSLESIKNDEVGLEIIYSGVGAINESDVNLAASSASTLIGFNVRADSKAKKIIEINNQELFYFSVIYELIDHVKNQLSGLLEPDIKRKLLVLQKLRMFFVLLSLVLLLDLLLARELYKRINP